MFLNSPSHFGSTSGTPGNEFAGGHPGVHSSASHAKLLHTWSAKHHGWKPQRVALIPALPLQHVVSGFHPLGLGFSILANQHLQLILLLLVTTCCKSLLILGVISPRFSCSPNLGPHRSGLPESLHSQRPSPVANTCLIASVTRSAILHTKNMNIAKPGVTVNNKALSSFCSSGELPSAPI